MNICIFYNTARNSKKKALMDDFGKSITHANVYYATKINEVKPNTNLVVCFAYVNKSNPLLVQTYYKLKQKGIIFLHIDSDPSVAYAQIYYFRISLNSVFKTEKADFFNEFEIDMNRWNKICTHKNIQPKPWRKINDGYILIFSQNGGGFAVQNTNIDKWVFDIIKKIRIYTKRKIVVRLKQKSKLNVNFTKLSDNIYISKNSSIFNDLNDAFVSVSYNTTASFVSIFEGIPTISMNPNSITYDIASHDLSQIETPYYPDRTEFFNKIAHSIWNRTEINNGTVWKRLKKYLDTQLVK